MLSILIPTYNYNVYPLVTELKNQADALAIPYEILILDDASSLFLDENLKIKEIENCFYSNNSKNIGRGNTINLLNFKAKFEYVLIMEADSFPQSKQYLKNYITAISPLTQIVFGGVSYPESKPKSNTVLRWKYGRNRESISLEQRLKNKYQFVFTWNLLLRKEILSEIKFPTVIKEYGYEDVAFIKKLKNSSIEIEHIDNQLIHLNEEASLVFIEKTEKAVSTLLQLINSNELDYKDISLGKIATIIKSLKLTYFISFIFKKSKNSLITNLTSNNPSLLLFDFYKLGCFCTITKDV